MGPDVIILVFWMLSFKPTFSLSSFTFIKRRFSSSSLSAIRVVSSAYLSLLIFLPAILIPACASSATTADDKTRVRCFTEIAHLLLTRVLKDRYHYAHVAGKPRSRVSQEFQASNIHQGQTRKSQLVCRLMRAAVHPWRIEADLEEISAPSPPTAGRCWIWSAEWPTAQNGSQKGCLPDKLNSNSIDAELSNGLCNLSGAGWH